MVFNHFKTNNIIELCRIKVLKTKDDTVLKLRGPNNSKSAIKYILVIMTDLVKGSPSSLFYQLVDPTQDTKIPLGNLQI